MQACFENSRNRKMRPTDNSFEAVEFDRSGSPWRPTTTAKHWKGSSPTSLKIRYRNFLLPVTNVTVRTLKLKDSHCQAEFVSSLRLARVRLTEIVF
jgi:hypothetical protein